MIPEGWNIKTIDNIATVFSGGTPSRSINGYYEGTIPWVKSGEVSQGHIYNTEEKITKEGLKNSSAKWVASGSVLLAMYGATAGKVGLLKINASINQAISAINGNKDTVENLYLYFFLQQMVPDILNKVQGSGQPNISGGIIKSLKVLLPPLPEQNKIAAILTSVDNAIQSTQKVIDQTQKVKQGLLQELLTKGIGHTEFKMTEIGEIPKEWEIATIGDYSDVIDPQPDHRTPPTVKDGIPYIGMADIKEGTIDFDNSRKVANSVLEKQKESFSINDSSFVFGKIGTIGFPTKIPQNRDFAYSANLILLTSPNKIFIELLYWIIQSPIIEDQIKNQTNTTSQPALGIKKVRNFKIPIPNISEQIEINSTFLNFQNNINKNIHLLTNLKKIKKGLMQDLLTGKVRVKV